MRLPSKNRRAAFRAIGAGALLAMSTGLSGCHWWAELAPGENLADRYGEEVGFCGLLQNCSNDGDSNRGGQQTATGSSSSGSSNGDSSTSEGAAITGSVQ
jgi:hypothetical protein